MKALLFTLATFFLFQAHADSRQVIWCNGPFPDTNNKEVCRRAVGKTAEEAAVRGLQEYYKLETNDEVKSILYTYIHNSVVYQLHYETEKSPKRLVTLVSVERSRDGSYGLSTIRTPSEDFSKLPRNATRDYAKPSSGHKAYMPDLPY